MTEQLAASDQSEDVNKMVEAKQALEVQLSQALDNNTRIADSMQILQLEKEGLS